MEQHKKSTQILTYKFDTCMLMSTVNSLSHSSTTLWTHCWIIPQRNNFKMVQSRINDNDPDQQLNGSITTVPVNKCL
jgi:hypothetical protein